MREIKFRGLSFRRKQWVYGDYFTDMEEEMPYIKTVVNDSGNLNEAPCTYQKNEHVTEDSVGQYTGLKDKNGVEIYEGDIVEYEEWALKDGKAGTWHKTGEVVRVPIVWTGEMLTIKWSSQGLLTHTGMGHVFEVVGNIHENQEQAE